MCMYTQSPNVYVHTVTHCVCTHSHSVWDLEGISNIRYKTWTNDIINKVQGKWNPHLIFTSPIILQNKAPTMSIKFKSNIAAVIITDKRHGDQNHDNNTKPWQSKNYGNNKEPELEQLGYMNLSCLHHVMKMMNDWGNLLQKISQVMLYPTHKNSRIKFSLFDLACQSAEFLSAYGSTHKAA